MRGLSTIGSISFGIALVAGKKRVPSPATGKTALRTGLRIKSPILPRQQTFCHSVPPARKPAPPVYGLLSKIPNTNVPRSCAGPGSLRFWFERALRHGNLRSTAQRDDGEER